MLTRVERAYVPVGLQGRCIEIEQGREHWQVRCELRGRSGPQPLSLPVATVSQPVNQQNDPDDAHFADGPCAGIRMEGVLRAIPSQRQRQHCTEHRNGAEEIDAPETAAIAIAVVEGSLVEAAMSRLNGRKKGSQPFGFLRRGLWRKGLQPDADQQQTLNCLVQRHYPTISYVAAKIPGATIPRLPS